MFKHFPTQYGIKMGLAGFLAFYTALILNLDSYTWSIMTVMVLMFAQYVGAIVEKSLYRIIGTVAGGALGVWLVGNHVQNAFFFLPVIFVIVAYCTYKFGNPRAPYAYFLCAMTAAIVVGASISQPEQVFHIALTRVLEISIGIVSSLVVTLLFWPRHASEEFHNKLIVALEKLKSYLMHRARTELLGANTENASQAAEPLHADFIQDFTGLRQLLHFAARESGTFRKKEPAYRAVLTTMNALQSCGIALQIRAKGDFILFEKLHSTFLDIINALDAEFHAIIRESRGEAMPPVNTQPAFAAFEDRLQALRIEGRTFPAPDEDFNRTGQFYLGLEEIDQRLAGLRARIAEAMGKAPAPTEETAMAPSAEPSGRWWKDLSSHPNRLYWIHNGIKGGIGFIVALLFIQWLEPPGQALLPLTAWIFIVMSRGFVHGQGDQRAFHHAALWAAGGTLYLFLAASFWTFLTPFLGVSLFLFATMFVFGYTTALVPGVNMGMQFWIFIVTGTIGLNAQKPVAFSSILDVYFGILLGMLIGAVIQRLLWPVLPQRELRSGLTEFFALLASALSKGFPTLLPPNVTSRLALIPNESRSWLQTMKLPRRHRGISGEIQSLLLNIQELNLTLQSLQRARRDINNAAEENRLEEIFQSMNVWIADSLSHFHSAFRSGVWTNPARSPEALLTALDQEVHAIRRDGALREASVSQVLHFFGLSERYRLVIENLEEIRDRMERLRLPVWARDTVL